MESPPPGTTIRVKGYSHHRPDPSSWHVDFINTYHLPFHVNLQNDSKDPWKDLHTVEIFADFGEKALDVGNPLKVSSAYNVFHELYPALKPRLSEMLPRTSCIGLMLAW